MKLEILLGIGGSILGGIGIGYGCACHKEMSRVAKKLDMTVDDLANGVDIEIPMSVVDKAVESEIEREATRVVDKAARDASAKILRDIQKEISQEVRKTVDDEYIRIKDSVTEQAAKEVARISVRRLSDEVVKKAKDEAAKKVNDSIDDILEKHNRELESITKIYKSIESSISKEK